MIAEKSPTPLARRHHRCRRQFQNPPAQLSSPLERPTRLRPLIIDRAEPRLRIERHTGPVAVLVHAAHPTVLHDILLRHLVVARQQLHQQVAAHAATSTGRDNHRKNRHRGDDIGTPPAVARGFVRPCSRRGVYRRGAAQPYRFCKASGRDFSPWKNSGGTKVPPTFFATRLRSMVHRMMRPRHTRAFTTFLHKKTATSGPCPTSRFEIKSGCRQLRLRRPASRAAESQIRRDPRVCATGCCSPHPRASCSPP